MVKQILAWSLGVSFFVLAMAGTAFAAGETPPFSIPTGPTSGVGFIDLLDNITDWLFVVLITGAVVFIVLAGWQFISAGGDTQAVSQARSKLLYAVIGIIVALLARGVAVAIRNIIGG